MSRKLLVLLIGVMVLLLTAKAALSAGLDVSVERVSLNLASDEQFSFAASFTDEFGHVVPAIKSVAEVQDSKGTTVLVIQGIRRGDEYVFQKDVSVLTAGNYVVRVHLDGNEHSFPLLLSSYPAGFGFLYDDGVLVRSRVITSFVVLGVVAVLCLGLLAFSMAGRRR